MPVSVLALCIQLALRMKTLIVLWPEYPNLNLQFLHSQWPAFPEDSWLSCLHYWGIMTVLSALLQSTRSPSQTPCHLLLVLTCKDTWLSAQKRGARDAVGRTCHTVKAFLVWISRLRSMVSKTKGIVPLPLSSSVMGNWRRKGEGRIVQVRSEQHSLNYSRNKRETLKTSTFACLP